MITKQFGSSAIQQLSERVAYEAWLLEAAYKLVEQELFPNWPDDAVVYRLGATTPQIFGFARAHIVIGDWRPGFLNAGAPLIFVAAFKLLDMLIEWVLDENGINSTHRFEQKLNHLESSPPFPAAVESRPWLKDRLVGLYKTLEPLRGTVIHGSNFTSTDGTISVSSSKKGVIGPLQRIDGAQLRRLAFTVVSVLRYISHEWPIDHYREKLLRHELDNLGPLHGLPLMDQKRPHHVRVRVYLKGTNLSGFDAEFIRETLAEHYKENDCSFDLRLLLVADKKVSSAYLIPWGSLEKVTPTWAGWIDDLDRYKIDIPDDIQEEHLCEKQP